MTQERAANRPAVAPSGKANPFVMRVLILAWVCLAVIAGLVLAPGRYTARTNLTFDLATQPPTVAVRGMIQVAISRDMAFSVLDGLSPEQVDRLGREGPFPVWLSGDDRAVRDRAAARLMAGLAVTPRQNGRVLDFSFTSGSPTLSAAIISSYVRAFSALQADVSLRADEGLAVPRLTAAGPVPLPQGRDVPPLPQILTFGAAAFLLAAATLQARAGRPAPAPAPAAPDLPPLADPLPRVAWLDAGRGTVFGEAEAAERLAAHIAAERSRIETRLVIVTSHAPTRAAGLCAINLSRALANENRVALVALDGASGDLAALIADPWAPGMAEMLFGVAGFGETIHRDPHSRAHVIPPGRESRTGASVIGAERLGLILTALRQTYDFVIVAAPALDAASGAGRLAELSPYVVCVDAREEEASVEPYAALASQGFPHVLMVRIALDMAEARTLRLVHSAPSLSAA